MTKITYKETANHSKVFLDEKIIGTIKKTRTRTIEGWIYYPKGDKNGGRTFPSRQSCKNYLEETHD